MRIPPADDTRRAKPKRKRTCECRNHLGKPKQAYRTQQQAVRYAATHTKYTGVTRIYQCPTSDRWHVTTQRERGA